MKIAFEFTGGDIWKAGIFHVKLFLYALKYTYTDVGEREVPHRKV